MKAFANVRKNGLQAITLTEGDELIGVKFTNGDEDIILTTRKGMSIRFAERDVRPTGRSSMGVRGILLREGDELVSIQLASQGAYMLQLSEKGLGKRTRTEEFKLQGRGGMGVKCYKIVEKTGDLVGSLGVNDGDEILVITDEGIMIRTEVDSISVLGRITSGVKVMNLAEGVTIANFAKVKHLEGEESVDGGEDEGEELSEETVDGDASAEGSESSEEPADDDSLERLIDAAERDAAEDEG